MATFVPSVVRAGSGSGKFSRRSKTGTFLSVAYSNQLQWIRLGGQPEMRNGPILLSSTEHAGRTASPTEPLTNWGGQLCEASSHPTEVDRGIDGRSHGR